MLNPLDSRVLMAAGLTASLTRGVLTIRGTASADVIDVTVGTFRPGKRGNQVVVEGVAATFQASQVKQISVLGGAGDDTITVENHVHRAIPMRIVGGAGNDTINGKVEFPPTPPSTLAPAPAPSPAPSPNPGPSPTPIPLPTDGGAVAMPVTPARPAPAPSLPAIEQRIVDLTNAERVKAGLSPLVVNGPLVEAAKIQAGNMARLDVMAHELPGTAQPTLTDRAAVVGYAYSRLAENIAFGYADADSVVAGWMASPGHRANILDPNLVDIGVSVAYNAGGRAYYAQVFGRHA